MSKTPREDLKVRSDCMGKEYGKQKTENRKRKTENGKQTMGKETGGVRGF
jgi:hypothetical protein